MMLWLKLKEMRKIMFTSLFDELSDLIKENIKKFSLSYYIKVLITTIFIRGL